MTPTKITLTPTIQEPQQDTTTAHQQLLTMDKHNNPWGDIWAVPTMAHTIWIASKNTSTINPQSLDMQAITHKLCNLNFSVFSGQETSIHWDTLTSYEIYQQCKNTALQIKLTMASSQEPAVEWYKPGGTLLLTLNPWTSCIVLQGSDTILGRWTYQEFLRKNENRVIVVSGYHVCNQKFDASANTATAQQIQLLQAQGVINPRPCRLFLTNTILQIKLWRQANKEVILCINANEPIDDPQSDVSKLFTETDLVDLHHHQHPGLRKLPTHQWGSQAIDLIAGSPLVASAMLHAWMHPFGKPATIKGDHRLLGIDINPEVLFGTAECTTYQQPAHGTNSQHNQKVTKFCK